MKTPIQELIEQLEYSIGLAEGTLYGYGLKFAKSKAEAMLEKEKEVMCQFAFDYYDKYCNNGIVPPVQDYFNETFNTKEI
jgi:hypothetical protein